MFKRILMGILAAAVASIALAADVKISAEPAMSALGGTEIFLGNQGGVTGTATGNQIATLVMASPPAAGFGSVTPRPVAATTLSASGAVSGAGFSTYLASPPAIGGSAAAAGSFTTLAASGLFSPSLGITAIGGVVNLNASSNNAVNIGTGTTTSTVTLGQNSATPGSVVLNGPVTFGAGTNFSGASWATVSPVFNAAALTLNDTTASGTITTEVAQSLQAANFTSTGGASTTITNAVQLWLPIPTCSGGVVCTNKYSLWAAGQIVAIQGITSTLGLVVNSAAINLNNNSNFAVNINTGTSTGTATIGQSAASPSTTVLAGKTSFTGGTAFTAASWTTTSPLFNIAAVTMNDTTASGTITDEAAQTVQSATFTSTGGASTTITNAAGLWVAAPTCSGGLVCTNLYAANIAGNLKVVGSSNGNVINGPTTINGSVNNATSINTGTSTGTTTIGGTTAGNATNLASVSIKVGAVLYASVTAPTISSHFNSSGDSIVAASTAAFQITVGSGAGTTTGAVTMPTATTGWACEATDVTTPASHAIQQTGSSTTLVTVTDYIRTTGIAQNFANGDKINFICGAF